MKKCMFCNNEYDESDAAHDYCSFCGAPTRNKCTDYSCGSELDNNACFCKYCGSPSLFYNVGLLEPEKVFRQKACFFINDTDEELPF